jgi:hypothetical protein
MVDERSGSGDVPWQTSSTDEPRSWTVGAYRDRGQPTLGHDRGDARARLVAD